MKTKQRGVSAGLNRALTGSKVAKTIKLLAALCLCIGVAQADEYVSCTLDLADNHQLQPVAAWLNLTTAGLPKADRQKTVPELVLVHNITFEAPALSDEELGLLPRDPNDASTSDPNFLFDPDTLSMGAVDGLTTKISLQSKDTKSVVSISRIRNFTRGNIFWKASGTYKGHEILPMAACTEIRADFFNKNKKSLDAYKAVIERANKSWN